MQIFTYFYYYVNRVNEVEDLWVIKDALFISIEIVNYNLAHFSAMKISSLYLKRGSHVQILHLCNNRLGTYSQLHTKSY